MSKLKPIIDIPPGTKTLWHTLAEYLGNAHEMFKGMADGMKQPIIDRGYPELADGVYLMASIMKNSAAYLNEYERAKAQGKTMTLYNFCVPPELFYMMDNYPICQEFGSVALALASIGSIITDYIDLAEEAGISTHECNAQKVWLGALLKGEALKPDAIVYASQPCDSTNIQYQIMQSWYDIPTFTLDIPYWSHESENSYHDESVVPYMAGQLKKLMGFLEKVSGKKADDEKLKSVLMESNKAREYILESYEYMKHKPCPLTSLTPLISYATLLTSAGLPVATEYCKMVRDFAKKAVKRGIGAIDLFSGGKKEEKIRIFWSYIPIFHDYLLFEWMEKKLGAQVIFDMLGYQIAKPVDLSSEEAMFADLGKTVLDTPMARQSRGPIEFYSDDAIRIVKEYKIDCMIYAGHVGCKHGWGGARMVHDLVKEETGVPSLLFEVDSMDPRVVRSREFKKKIRLFIEGQQ